MDKLEKSLLIEVVSKSSLTREKEWFIDSPAIFLLREGYINRKTSRLKTTITPTKKGIDFINECGSDDS